MARGIFHVLVLAVIVSAVIQARPGGLTSIDALVQALQQRDATVRRTGSLPASAYPFFSVNAQGIQVNGADVNVFEYASAKRADSDASRVSPTGSPIGQSQIAWIDAPHFYKRDRLIVLYVGHSADLLKLLEDILGPPFASGQ